MLYLQSIQKIPKKKKVNNFAFSLQPLTVLRSGDVTEGHGASCSPCQDTTFPSTWFTCSGNIVWLLPYPWRWTPADALDPGSSDGLISMHGWGLSSSLIGPVSSWHGLWLTPAEDPAGCMPPSHHAHACCIPHDWTRPPGPRDHAPVQWMSVPECLTDSHAMMVSFYVFATNV